MFLPLHVRLPKMVSSLFQTGKYLLFVISTPFYISDFISQIISRVLLSVVRFQTWNWIQSSKILINNLLLTFPITSMLRQHFDYLHGIVPRKMTTMENIHKDVTEFLLLLTYYYLSWRCQPGKLLAVLTMSWYSVRFVALVLQECLRRPTISISSKTVPSWPSNTALVVLPSCILVTNSLKPSGPQLSVDVGAVHDTLHIIVSMHSAFTISSFIPTSQYYVFKDSLVTPVSTC